MAAFIAGPGLAQTRSITAEEAIANARAAYRHERPKPRCGGVSEDEIVVCAPESGDRYRVPSTSESDPNSREAQRALNNGVPRAPDLEPHHNGVSVARGCFVPPCPKAMLPLIDFAKIPEAPEGSDADKIARGEAPAP